MMTMMMMMMFFFAPHCNTNEYSTPITAASLATAVALADVAAKLLPQHIVLAHEARAKGAQLRVLRKMFPM